MLIKIGKCFAARAEPKIARGLYAKRPIEVRSVDLNNSPQINIATI